MDDAHLEVIKAEIRRLEQKVDAGQDTLEAQLRPLVQLYRGNGKPSLEARVFHVEREVDDQTNNTRWAIRSAVAAMLAALGTVLWSIIRQG